LLSGYIFATLRRLRGSSRLKNFWRLLQIWNTSEGCKYVSAQQPRGFLKNWRTFFSRNNMVHVYHVFA
jgi:hypothetical protein